MVTTRGARALGLEHETGSLSQGLSADLAVVPWSGSTQDWAHALAHHSGDLHAAMCFGHWTWGPT